MKKVLFAALVALAGPAAAQTETTPSSQAQPPQRQLALRPIEPANALERTFVGALNNAALRPAFRRQLLESHVALALQSNAAGAPPLELPIREGVSAAAIFTSSERLDAVMGADTPRAVMTGRAALERLRGKNVVVNLRLLPMLTLEPDDVARYLETPESPASAGPTQ